MSKKEIETGWVDMDRLSRIFTWLTATILTFMLGMVFDQLIFADLSTAKTIFQQSGVPYTLTYPVGWSAAFDRKNDLISKSSSNLASDSDTLLALTNEPVTQVSGVNDGYLVELGKIKSDAKSTYEAILTDSTATSVTVSGVTKAAKKSNLPTNTGTQDEVVMQVGTDIYVMDLAALKNSVDYSSTTATILESLQFN